jgi:hypothetical protein
LAFQRNPIKTMRLVVKRGTNGDDRSIGGRTMEEIKA